MKKERQKGSITVEATLFIPIFLFAFMSILQSGFFCKSAASDTVCGRSGCQGGCPVQLYSGKNRYSERISGNRTGGGRFWQQPERNSGKSVSDR